MSTHPTEYARPEALVETESNWRADLQDPVIPNYISPEKFARLCSRDGVTPGTACIFYGDA